MEGSEPVESDSRLHLFLETVLQLGWKYEKTWWEYRKTLDMNSHSLCLYHSCAKIIKESFGCSHFSPWKKCGSSWLPWDQNCSRVNYTANHPKYWGKSIMSRNNQLQMNQAINLTIGFPHGFDQSTLSSWAFAGAGAGCANLERLRYAAQGRPNLVACTQYGQWIVMGWDWQSPFTPPQAVGGHIPS